MEIKLGYLTVAAILLTLANPSSQISQRKLSLFISSNGIQLIKQFEGFRAAAYQDSAGIWTIGYGTTLYPNGSKVKRGDRCTEAEAVAWLAAHVNTQVLPTIYKRINQSARQTLTQNQLDALASIIYNIGGGNFAKSTLNHRVNANPNDPTIADAFMMWNKARNARTGQLEVLAGLDRRRKAEATLYFRK